MSLYYTGVNSSYTGNTTVNGGTLQISGTITTASNNLSVDGAAANTPAAILGAGGYISNQTTSVGVNGAGSFTQTEIIERPPGPRIRRLWYTPNPEAAHL